MTDVVERAKRLMENVTPGPWKSHIESDCYCHDDGNSVSVAIGKRDHHAFALAMHQHSERIVDANAKFIAESRQLVPDLVARIDELEAPSAIDDRPMTTDAFLVALIEKVDDHYDREEAISEWLHGDWNAALEYMEDDQ